MGENRGDVKINRTPTVALADGGERVGDFFFDDVFAEGTELELGAADVNEARWSGGNEAHDVADNIASEAAGRGELKDDARDEVARGLAQAHRLHVQQAHGLALGRRVRQQAQARAIVLQARDDARRIGARGRQAVEQLGFVGRHHASQTGHLGGFGVSRIALAHVGYRLQHGHALQHHGHVF